MYLATLRRGGSPHFQLRQSQQCENGFYRHRLVFDLGFWPMDHFEVFDDHVILFSSKLLTAAEEAVGKEAEILLESLLTPFFPKEIQRRQSLFRTHRVPVVGPVTAAEKEKIKAQIHLFDRRRLYYLRYGAVDQSRLHKLHEKCCRPLIGQSRDEREYWFMEEERALRPSMYFEYVFAIFNLQRHFNQSFAPWLPLALAYDEIAERLEQGVCHLMEDPRFWQSQEKKEILSSHLARYLIMFFDADPAPGSSHQDYLRSTMGSHRRFSWPEKKVKTPAKRLEKLFAKDHNQLKRLSRVELTRLYRKKAMELHPDQGGDHDLFIELSQAYDELLAKKS